MIASDLGSVIILAIILQLYNAVMTAVFISQRFDLNKYKFLLKSLVFSAVIFSGFFLQFLFRYLPGYDISVWFLAYTVTITLLVAIDKYAKRKKKTRGLH